MIEGSNLYITLQFLRTVEGQHKYHWGLFSSGTNPPAGHLIHATDAGRSALDLYQDVRTVRDPLRSGTMVVVLKISHSPGLDALKYCAEKVRLMDPRHLPPGERQWTCRVWVLEVLATLQKKGYIGLPFDIRTIEQACQYTADSNLSRMGNARVFNDLGWIQPGSFTRSAVMDVGPSGGSSYPYYGPSPMAIDSQPTSFYFGSKPMIVDSSNGTYFG